MFCHSIYVMHHSKQHNPDHMFFKIWLRITCGMRLILSH